ncbi:hypothetical protein ACFC9G_07305, partial [Enterococcus casseliflavus]|uniref:hypothetical protein n=1 Tax=Enterococcus casseliflavus TaxID=37734 RepID=UPI0039A62B24
GLNDGALAATGAPFYFTQKTARNERFLVISCGFLLWTYVTVPQVVSFIQRSSQSVTKSNKSSTK